MCGGIKQTASERLALIVVLFVCLPVSGGRAVRTVLAVAVGGGSEAAPPPLRLRLCRGCAEGGAGDSGDSDAGGALDLERQG